VFVALHIHISSEMNAVLDELDWGFMTLERGLIEVKVRGLSESILKTNISIYTTYIYTISQDIRDVHR